MRFPVPALFLSILALTACSQSSSPDQSSAGKPPQAKSTPSKAAALNVKFKPYEVRDPQQQNMIISRLAVPEDWKTTSHVVWNMNDFYWPVFVSARTESPDASEWIEFYPALFFLWLDPQHDRGPVGPGSIGGIHHPNITLPEALVRYVIAPHRRNVKNLKVLGYRPVKNLENAFNKAIDPKNMPQGEAICMRVSYEINGAPMDEEFYAFMTSREAIPGPNRNIPIMEYHRRMFLVHSMGAKAGKIESVRPLLGFVATSIEPNIEWQKRVGEVQKMQTQYFNRVMQQNYAGIQAAGERAKMTSAQSDQFLRQIDASLAQSHTTSSTPSYGGSNDDFYKRADEFDQGIRGTEHMKDQYGQVSDQYTDYNYHWTTGFGEFVHTNDPNFNPNQYLNGNYEQMTPVNQ